MNATIDWVSGYSEVRYSLTGDPSLPHTHRYEQVAGPEFITGQPWHVVLYITKQEGSVEVCCCVN